MKKDDRIFNLEQDQNSQWTGQVGKSRNLLLAVSLTVNMWLYIPLL